MTKTMRTVAQTAVLMAILTLLSKVFGFAREMVMANFFGTSYITDSYVMATTIPTVIFGGIFTAVATAYMPLYSKIEEDKGVERGNRFTSEVINLFLVISIISSVVGIVFSDTIVSIFASGFVGETANLTSFFLKVTFSYVLFTSTAGVLEAYLQYRGVFLLPLTIGCIQNIIVMLVTMFSALTNHYFLAVGWLLAHLVRVIVLGIIAKRKDFHYIPSFKVDDTIKRIAIVSIPVFIGTSVQQINTFVDKTIASSLPEGSVAALNYGMLLVTLITGITITVLSTLLYPKLNQANATGNHKRFSEMVETAVSLTAIIAIPCALGAMVYHHQIVQVVYERGAFDPSATAMTSTAFLYFAIGLVFLSLNDVLLRAYYAMHDMKTPMIFAGIGVIINIILNLILVKSMAHNGLALATSISYFVNTVLLVIGMRTKYPYIKILRSKTKILKICAASVIAVGFSYLFYHYIILQFVHVIYMRVVQLGLAVIVAGIVYLTLLISLKIIQIDIIKNVCKLD